VLAKLLDLDVKMEHIDGSETADASYLALNPLGKIPTFVDGDGFVLTECSAILTYSKLPRYRKVHNTMRLG
jgi:elongation factor 1-gamma